MSTPKDLGYRMPAEWEPHAATWLSWPHNPETWPGKFERVQPVFAQMVTALAESETVHMNINDIGMEREARGHLRAAGTHGEIHFHHFPTNDAWCRDHGAVFVTRDSSGGDGSLAAVDWGYNAWGGKYPPYDLDNAIPVKMAKALSVPRFEPGMILEGGSIDVNGQGLLLTTESCLLNKNRNPEFSREEIEQLLIDYLDVERILWLRNGIKGDDTDGHVDDLARFVAPDVVVTVVEQDRSDINYQPLAENLARLKRMDSVAGRPLDVVELPMPPAVFWEGERLPATYANFYIANEVVLFPGYDACRDEYASGILKELLPDREIIIIPSTDIIWGLGACHCLTQQVPTV